MYTNEWLTIVTMVTIYLGFAGVLGSLLRPGMSRILAGIYTLLLLLPAAVSIPLSLPWSAVFWISALAIVILFARQPGWLPGWLWTPRFGCSYFGTLMGLVLIWTAVTGRPDLWFKLGIPAATAGLLGWWRAWKFVL